MSRLIILNIKQKTVKLTPRKWLRLDCNSIRATSAWVDDGLIVFGGTGPRTTTKLRRNSDRFLRTLLTHRVGARKYFSADAMKSCNYANELCWSYDDGTWTSLSSESVARWTNLWGDNYSNYARRFINKSTWLMVRTETWIPEPRILSPPHCTRLEFHRPRGEISPFGGLLDAMKRAWAQQHVFDFSYKQTTDDDRSRFAFHRAKSIGAS